MINHFPAPVPGPRNPLASVNVSESAAVGATWCEFVMRLPGFDFLFFVRRLPSFFPFFCWYALLGAASSAGCCTSSGHSSAGDWHLHAFLVSQVCSPISGVRVRVCECDWDWDWDWDCVSLFHFFIVVFGAFAEVESSAIKNRYCCCDWKGFQCSSQVVCLWLLSQQAWRVRFYR